MDVDTASLDAAEPNVSKIVFIETPQGCVIHIKMKMITII